MNVGIIGCGNISPTYFNAHKFFNNFKVTTCADINTLVKLGWKPEKQILQ